MLTLRIALSVFLSALAGIAVAGDARLGGSLGMFFPSGKLADGGDKIGSKPLPTPSLGVHVLYGPIGDIPDLSLEGMVEAATFKNEDDKGLRLLYVPLQAAGLWAIGSMGNLKMQIRAGAGAGLLSSNMGSQRSLSGFTISLGWRVEKELKGLSCAVETGLDVLMNGGTQNMLRFKLMLLTR